MTAASVDTARRFRQRLHHDHETGQLSDGPIRYLIMRPDALMGMFDRLPTSARAEALAALAGSVAEFGGRSVTAYLQARPGNFEALLRVIEQISADLGWGLWRFQAGQDGNYGLTVRNSPFAAGIAQPASQPACAPIQGMLTAIAAQIFGNGGKVIETHCAACHGGDTCHFTCLQPGATVEQTNQA
ncbi:4-vinyl reductase [Paracoccus sp. MKU1]|uniref:4-vinyl reductase n=1 Tax=Paracoccus sp. MKU1 TaxID=1745182 RepID=UPI00071907E7|nr:4-vinyl reductase [Paracoccus sp. MKU1]KRW95245.1 hypothetical protein AQY21_15725 [Paracoccus sp. MKU1]